MLIEPLAWLLLAVLARLLWPVLRAPRKTDR